MSCWRAYGVADKITFDLGETRGMEYYTGITFKGYTPGLGFSICSGGRYDDLVGHFGRPQPAVGCALVGRSHPAGPAAARLAASASRPRPCCGLLMPVPTACACCWRCAAVACGSSWT